MPEPPETYLLLADLTASTRLEPQAAYDTMHILTTTLDDINAHATGLQAPLEINYGDEFAGLFHRLADVYDVVSRVRHELRGLAAFRFVAAKGRIAYPAGSIRQMGGPVFRTANDALGQLKSSGRFAAWKVGAQLLNAALDTITNLSHVLISDMTDYQYDIYVRLQDGKSQTEIASALGKYDQAISKAIKRSQADLVIDAEATLRDQLVAHDQTLQAEEASI